MDDEDRCLHDMELVSCGLCKPRAGAVDVGTDRRSGIGTGDDGSKQDLVTDLCRLLGRPRLAIGVGSSVPSELFDELARRYGLRNGSMPEVGEAVALRAGMAWEPSFDSRASLSGGGSTVTAAGLKRLTEAVRRLEAKG